MAHHTSPYPRRPLSAGTAGYSDGEILELALCALPERDGEKLSKALPSRAGSWPRVRAAPSSELLSIEGLGTAGAAPLKADHAAALCLLRAELTNGPVLNNWRRLVGYLHTELSRERVDQLQILYLDNRYCLLALRRLVAEDVWQLNYHPENSQRAGPRNRHRERGGGP